jgi:hypothetical protein
MALWANVLLLRSWPDLRNVRIALTSGPQEVYDETCERNQDIEEGSEGKEIAKPGSETPVLRVAELQ